MSRRRAAQHEAQGLLPFAGPVPAPGTVAIIRIEDLRQMFAEIGRAPALAPVQRNSGSSKHRWMARHVAEVEHWLGGKADSATYALDLHRDPKGRVLSVTAAELVACLPSFGEGNDAHRQKALAGQVLASLGWAMRYLTNPQLAKRERRFFPPPDWE